MSDRSVTVTVAGFWLEKVTSCQLFAGWFAAGGRAASRRFLGALPQSGCGGAADSTSRWVVVSAGSAAGWARALRAVVGGPGVGVVRGGDGVEVALPCRFRWLDPHWFCI